MTAPYPPEDERVVAEDPDFPPPGAARGPSDLSRFTLHLVGHAHIDLGYRWNQAETVHYVSPWTFRGVLDLMDRTPGFTFCQSQIYLYEAMRREYPDLFARILDKVRAGTWEVVGGTWCEYDAILPAGESVIRQYLHGVRYARDVLGAPEQRVAFVPDSFCGHAATLPQILAGCGFRWYVFGRGLPQDPAAPEMTRRAFRWIGPDGGEVVAYLPFGPYSTPPLTEAFLANYLPYARASVSDHELVLHGQGDHGGGPRDAEIQALQSLAMIPGAPQWRYSTVHQLCEAAFDAATVAGLSAHRGNLGGFATGALTSQAVVKRRNRLLEKRLLAAEATAVVGTLLARKPAFPRLEVRDLWRQLLTEQFHDILPGTSVASVYRDTHRAYDAVEAGAGYLETDGFDRIRSRLDTRGPGVCLVAYNPGLLPAAAPIYLDLPEWVAASLPAGARLLGPDGAPVPFHREGDRLTFPAALPPLGYAAYRLVPVAAGRAVPRDAPLPGAASPASLEALGEGRPAPAVRAGPAAPARLLHDVLEAGAFRLAFDPDTGDLAGLDRRDGDRPLLRGPSNTLDLHREMGIATSWVHALTGEREPLYMVSPPRVVEASPFLTRVATTSRSAASTFTREVVAYAQGNRVDFRLQTEWREGNAFLKLGFELALDAPAIRTSVAHGSTAIADPVREFCMHDWVILDSGGRHGAVAFLNDGAYGCHCDGTHFGISCIRTVRDMDPTMAHGRHELRYSLVPLPANAPDSALLPHLGSFGCGVRAAFEPAHPGGIKTWGSFDNSQPLAAARSFVRPDCDHVVLCAFKIPEEDWLPLSFVLRLREVDGKAADCWVDLPVVVTRAVRADHLERPANLALECQGNRVRVPLRPHEIATAIVYV
ncbi:MAG: glycoside hydrolase family 38 C-terminal domain-containing protein [Gemmatimonadota bacterium]